jgi:hypothetical protein
MHLALFVGRRHVALGSVQYNTFNGFNPNLGGWGLIWLSKFWTGITPQRLKWWKFCKLMYIFLKMSREYILLSTFRYKTAFSAIFRAKSAGNWPFWCRFHTFRAAWKAYLTSLTPPPPPPPGRVLPLPIVGTPSSSWAALAVSSSF